MSSNKDNITKELPWLPDDVQKKLFDNALSYPRVIYNGTLMMMMMMMMIVAAGVRSGVLMDQS